jgi:chloramphenicol 3-O-phosphotransferase
MRGLAPGAELVRASDAQRLRDDSAGAARCSRHRRILGAVGGGDLLRVHAPSMTHAGAVVITGAMAAGKSTIAQGLAARLPRAVHVRGDVFRRMIVSGRAAMDAPLGEAARAQLRLRHRLAALVTDEYVRAGFTSVVQDLYLGDDLPDFLRLLSSRPVHLVVLAPEPDVLSACDSSRASPAYGAWSAEEFHRLVVAETPRIGLWLDTSGLTVEATVERVLSELPAARIDFPV